MPMVAGRSLSLEPVEIAAVVSAALALTLVVAVTAALCVNRRRDRPKTCSLSPSCLWFSSPRSGRGRGHGIIPLASGTTLQSPLSAPSGKLEAALTPGTATSGASGTSRVGRTPTTLKTTMTAGSTATLATGKGTPTLRQVPRVESVVMITYEDGLRRMGIEPGTIAAARPDRPERQKERQERKERRDQRERERGRERDREREARTEENEGERGKEREMERAGGLDMVDNDQAMGESQAVQDQDQDKDQDHRADHLPRFTISHLLGSDDIPTSPRRGRGTQLDLNRVAELERHGSVASHAGTSWLPSYYRMSTSGSRGPVGWSSEGGGGAGE